MFGPYSLAHPLTVSRTGEAFAAKEYHALHAHGKVHLGDIPCEKKDRERKEIRETKMKDKMRNEGVECG
jgi:hypothetical protein